MDYSNPKIPEGINTSKQHPLKELAWLTASVAGIALLVLTALTLFVDLFAGYIPFSAERHVAGQFEKLGTSNPPLQRYLQGLADRVATAQGLPDDMPITVHYLDDDTVNAFATLGGHVIFHRGLLEKIPHENALAMLVAHEVAHINKRDPIRGFGRGVVLGVALTLVSQAAGNAVLDSVLNKTGYLTALSFSRDQERDADEAALKAVSILYGSLQGADALFKILQAEDNAPSLAFLSSHPLTEERLQHLREAQGAPSPTWQATPLPNDFSDWLATPESTEKEIQQAPH